MTTEEVLDARDHWLKREQSKITEIKETPGYGAEQEKETGILKCYGRITDYNSPNLDMGLFAEKLITHTHQEVMHFGVADTMAAIRENWWIPRLRVVAKRYRKGVRFVKFFQQTIQATVNYTFPKFRTNISW